MKMIGLGLRRAQENWLNMIKMKTINTTTDKKDMNILYYERYI